MGLHRAASQPLLYIFKDGKVRSGRKPQLRVRVYGRETSVTLAVAWRHETKMETSRQRPGLGWEHGQELFPLAHSSDLPKAHSGLRYVSDGESPKGQLFLPPSPVALWLPFASLTALRTTRVCATVHLWTSFSLQLKDRYCLSSSWLHAYI